MMIQKRSYRRVWILVLLAIVSFAAWRIFFRPAPVPPVSVTEIRSREGTPVTVNVVDLAPWEHWLTIYGRTQASSEVKVAAERQEYVASVSVDIGDTVVKGQVMATLDRQAAREKLAAQEAVASEMESRYSRLKVLQSAGGASAQEVEAALSAARNARAGLKDLQISFSRLTITSPISGVVTGRTAEQGNLVSPGQALFTVSDLTALEAVLDVAPDDVTRIIKGMPSRIRTPNGWVDSDIRRVDPVADQVTGLFKVVLSIPPRSGLIPGQTVEAQIQDENIADALLVPYEAVKQVGGERMVVYLLSSGDTVIERDIIAGETFNGKVRILSGLSPGDTIVVKGSDRLFPNARVWIQED